MSAKCNECSKERFHFLGFDSPFIANKVTVTSEFPLITQEIILSDSTNYNIILSEHEALLATLNITNIEIVPDDAAFKNGVVPLKGVTVNEILLGWIFTQDSQSVDVFQRIDGTQVSPDTVKSFNKTSLSLVFDSLEADRTSILFGDDEENLSNSTITVQKVLEFGNIIWFGEANFEDDDNDLRTLLTSLSKEIRTDQNITVNPTSLAGDIFVYIAIPTDLGIDTVFVDLASPMPTNNPMEVHRSNFTLSNSLTNDTYTVYISKQTALRDSIITPAS